MTERERDKCKILVNEAIQSARSAKADFEQCKTRMATDSLSLETIEKRGLTQYNYADGIYHALTVIGFNHPYVDELKKLL